ncbi:MAG TPA: YcxB family protein [Phycisphaerae bacterium]|nr:YcxB family protein [Phycisphaerae bacterium]
MKYEVTAEYSEELIKAAVRRFITKHLGWKDAIAWSLMLIVFIVLLRNGECGWLLGALGATLFMFTAVAIAVYVKFRRNALSAFRAMTTGKAQFVFDEEGFSVASDLGTGTFKWRIIRKIWRFPEAWLLFYSSGTYSTLPTACLSDELKAFILTKVEATGGKISPRGSARPQRQPG